MAITRLGSGGYGIRRAGSFADKAATEPVVVAVQGIGRRLRAVPGRLGASNGRRSNIQRSTR